MVGEKEQSQGCVDIRSREGQMIGRKRVDEAADFFRLLLPQKSNSYSGLYGKAWSPEDFPKVEAQAQVPAQDAAQEKQEEEVKQQ